MVSYRLMPLAVPSGSDRLPPGRHIGSADEIEATFVTSFPSSATRRPLFDQWKLLREAIGRLIAIEEQWLDGSYVTTEEDPADIDVVSHFDGEQLDKLDPVTKMMLLGLVGGHSSRDLHGCDSFGIAMYPAGHPARPAYEHALRYWEALFGHQRDGSPKGYVEVDS